MAKWLSRLAEKNPETPTLAPYKNNKNNFVGFVGTHVARFQEKNELIHWSALTPAQMKDLWRRVKQGSVRLYSDTLNEPVWWVRDAYTAEELRSQGITEVCYTAAALKALAGKPAAFLRDVHQLKKRFEATLRPAPAHPETGATTTVSDTPQPQYPGTVALNCYGSCQASTAPPLEGARQ